MNFTRSRFTRVATIGATTAAFGGVAFASPAHADPAPTCLHTSLNDSGSTDYLTVTNTCGAYKNYKVKLAFRADSSCTGINAGASQGWSWGYPGRFDGLESC